MGKKLEMCESGLAAQRRAFYQQVERTQELQNLLDNCLAREHAARKTAGVDDPGAARGAGREERGADGGQPEPRPQAARCGGGGAGREAGRHGELA